MNNQKFSAGLVKKEVILDKENLKENDDQLGFQKYIKPFFNYIYSYINIYPKSLIVGVYGDWGSGKSVFLNYVKKYIGKNRKKEKFFEFNAWKYKNENDLNKFFVFRILDEIEFPKRRLLNKIEIIKNKSKNNIKYKILAKIESLLRLWSKKSQTRKKNKLKNQFQYKISHNSTNSVSLILPIIIIAIVYWLLTKFILENFPSSHNLVIPMLSALGIVITLLYNSYKSLSVKYTKEPISHQDQYMDDLQDLIESSPIKRYYILIENIDRCHPKEAIRLLESLKTILDLKNCTFLIACDSKVLENEIQEMYKNQNICAEDYLRKIIGVHYNIPRPETIYLEGYVQSLLQEDMHSKIKNIMHMLKTSEIINPREIKDIFREWDMAHNFMISLAETTLDPIHLLNIIILKTKFYLYYEKLIESIGSIDKSSYSDLIHAKVPADIFNINEKSDSEKEALLRYNKATSYVQNNTPKFPKSSKSFKPYVLAIKVVEVKNKDVSKNKKKIKSDSYIKYALNNDHK